MDSLHQRLKELDPDTFHKLCFMLIKERHPGANVHLVEGASGDEGLDIFEGELDGQPTIWQCKSFPNGVAESQKGQIRESLHTALQNFTPKNWILCLSVNMDSKAYRWWQRYKQSKASVVTVGEMFASQIVHELIHRRTLRNHFFPGAALDPIELKKIASRTGELTTEELAAITQNNIEDYIERLKERDARFNYELVFSGDLGPEKAIPSPKPGLVMSMSNGVKTLNVYARDVEALQQNPPKMNMTFSGTGIEKFKTLIETGIAQTFQDTEFQHGGSNTPIFDMDYVKGTQLYVGPVQSLLNKRIKTRITFQKDQQIVEYSFIELAPTRAGTNEIEFKTVSPVLPFEMNFTLVHVPPSGQLNYIPRFVGHEIAKIAKFADVIRFVYSGANVTIWDLEREGPLFTFDTRAKPMTDAQANFFGMLDDLKRIMDKFRLDLKWPKDISKSDFETIDFLKGLVHGIDKDLSSATCTIVKTNDVYDLAPTMNIRFVQSNYDPQPTLFGHLVNTGPVRFTMIDAEVSDYKVTASAFKTAQIGESVHFKFILNKPTKIELGADN